MLHAHHAQRKTETAERGGRSLVGDKVSRPSPEHAARGGSRVRSAGIVRPKAHAAVAKVSLVATGLTPSIPIALRSPDRIERSRGTVLPTGWRTAHASRLLRFAEILSRETTRRDTLEPFRIDACFPEPSRQSHSLERLSSVAGFDAQQHGSKGIGSVQESVGVFQNVIR